MGLYHQIKNRLNEDKENWYYLCNDAEQALFKVKNECKDERAISAIERMILDLNSIRMEQYEALVEYALVEETNEPINIKVGDTITFYSNGYKDNGKFSNKKDILMTSKVIKVNPDGSVSCTDPQGVKSFDYISKDEILTVNGNKLNESFEGNFEDNNIKVDLHNSANNPVWIIGDITINGNTYRVNAKVYLEGSEFGIDEGPISKLYIADPSGKAIINYERGWDIKPTSETNEIYNIVKGAVQSYRNNNPYEVDREPEGINESVNNKTVYTICYSTIDVWDNSDSALNFFLEGTEETEGAEQERYIEIVKQLQWGNSIASDNGTESISKIIYRNPQDNFDMSNIKTISPSIKRDKAIDYIRGTLMKMNESVIKENTNTKGLIVCDRCLKAIESKEGPQETTKEIPNDSVWYNGEEEEDYCTCEWCGDDSPLSDCYYIEGDKSSINESINNNSIEYATPCYTGGGVYAYTGKLKDGNYFLGSDDWFSKEDNYFTFRIVNEDPDKFPDDCFYDDWQQEHFVKDLSLEENKKFTKQVLNWIIKNKPEGNYQIGDMKDLLSIVNEK